MTSLSPFHWLRKGWNILLYAFVTFLPTLVHAQSSGGGGSSAGGGCLNLLEPLPDGTTQSCPSGNPFGVINDYLRPVLSWMVGIAAGLAILMIIIGGLQIITSGGNDSKIGEGKKRVTEAIIGLLILVFSATILYFLNAYFFKLV